jgi:small conductance mechanosensitive channel
MFNSILSSLGFLIQNNPSDTLSRNTSTVQIIDKFKNIFGISWDEGKQLIIHYATNLFFAVLVLVIGWWIAKWSGKAVRKILTQSKTDAGLVTFLASLVTILLKVLVIVTAINQVGVQMTSFIAILGAAGLAIGMAFSGTLSNFAGGVMILLFKPFKVGDTILAQTHQGKVTEIQIFYTYLYTSDNKVVIIPNGPLANNSLVNFTKEGKRRVDWVFYLQHGQDYPTMHQQLIDYMNEDKRIFQDPEPFVAMKEVTKESINITVRAWCETDDFWPVYFSLNETMVKRFEEKNIHLAKA